MSYAIHAYLFDEEMQNENLLFDSIKKIFSASQNVEFAIVNNFFTKKNFLKLKVEKKYSISIFFDNNQSVADDLKFILKKATVCNSRLRFLFAPDPENDFDYMCIIILEYLESLNKVLIYNVNQDKIIFSLSGNES